MADYKIRIIVEGEDRASGPLGGITGALGRMGEIAGGIGIARAFDAMADGAAQLGSAMVGMIANAGGLEAQIDAIGAISEATEQEMAGLAELINNLGINPNLKVSTFEAADAIGNLIANGLSLEEVFAGAAEQTVLLANATGADFGAAADIATDSMALFNIEAADMSTAVDGIAGVVAASKFDIYDYQLALAQGGGAAAVAGVSFEDFNTALTAVSSSFASGSDAGTSLKTMFQRLVPQSKEAASAMAELGLEFFNADGSMKDMAAIAGELNGAFADLSAEQRINYMATIFGTDAMRAAAGMANYTTEEFAALQAQIGKTDAMQAAAQRMNNLTGDWEVFGGVVEAVSLQVGAAFQEPARAAVQGLTQLVSVATPLLLQWADQAASFITPYVEGIVGTLTDPAWQANVSSQVTAFWENFTTNNRIKFNLGDVLEVDFSLDGAGEGITKFKLSDFFEFYSEDGAIEKIYLDQVIDFSQAEGKTKLSIFDVFDFESTEGGPVQWNVKDLVSFEGISDQEFTLTIGAFEYTSRPEGDYTITEWTFAGKSPEELMSDASAGLGQALADLSTASGFDAFYEKATTPIDVTLSPAWVGESPEAQLTEVTSKTWTVKIFGAWEFDLPDWLKVGSLDLLVHLKAQGLDGLGSAAAGAVAGALAAMNWNLKAPTIDMSGLSDSISDWFSSQTVEAPAVNWDSAGLAEWFAQQTFTLPLPGALSDMTFELDGADVLNSLASFAWPELPKFSWPVMPRFSWPSLPSWSWPALPSFAWPELPRFSWPAMPRFSWPSLPSWSWPAIPVPGWLSWLTGGGGGGETGRSSSNGSERTGLRWVGEFAPGMAGVPAGSLSFAAGQSRQMVAQGMGSQIVNVAATINTPLDIEELTRSIADRLRRRSW